MRAERDNLGGDHGIRRRMLAREIGRQDRELGFGLLERHARREPADQIPITLRAVIPFRVVERWPRQPHERLGPAGPLDEPQLDAWTT